MQTRYVYRAPDETPPRANASGGQNVLRLGAVTPTFRNRVNLGAAFPVGPSNRPTGHLVATPERPRLVPVASPAPSVDIAFPPAWTNPKPTQELCPAWGCEGPPNESSIEAYEASVGATSSVPQPPPFAFPVGSAVVPVPGSSGAGGPSPTVAVSSSQTSPSLTTPGTPLSTTGSTPTGWSAQTAFSVGQSVVDQNGNLQQVTIAGMSGTAVPAFNPTVGGTTSDGSVVWANMGTSGTSTGVSGWLSSSTPIAGYNIPNWGIAAAVGFGLFYMMKGKR